MNSPIMTQITKLAQNATKFVSDNSPTILTAMSVAGVVTTSVMAVKATPEAVRDIWDAESELTEVLSPKDKIKLCWKHYVPALTMGAMTIACIISANTISTKRNAALMSLYTFTEKSLKEYQEKVVETFGENKEQKVRDDIAQDRVNNDPVSTKQVIITGGGDVLCYDTLSGRYFENNIEAIRKAENDLNKLLLDDGYASQNEFYHLIGLPPTKLGEELGWTSENLLSLEFSSVLSEDNRPCLSINYRVEPKVGYYKFG